MTNYVYSTLANDHRYIERNKNNAIVAEVFIAGKANVPNKHMLTSRGVVTKVTDEQLAILRNNRVFLLHEKNGFLTVDKRKIDPEKAADSMNGNDPSQPDTEARLVSEKKKAPKSNKSE